MKNQTGYSQRHSPGNFKKVAYNLDYSKLGDIMRDKKRSESVMEGIMPPIINFNEKVVFYYRIQRCLVPPKTTVILPNLQGGLDKGGGLDNVEYGIYFLFSINSSNKLKFRWETNCSKII